MVNLDLIFNYGGEWTREPQVKYTKKLLHIWEGYDSDHLSFIDIVNEFCTKLCFGGVQQLIVSAHSGRYYKIDGDSGIKKLLGMVCSDYNVVDIFVVEDCELAVNVPDILHYGEDELDDVALDHEAATDCSSTDGEFDNEAESDSSDNDSEELEFISTQRSMSIIEQLLDYKELDKNMSFKDISEARKCLKLYAMANKKEIVLKKSDTRRLRYKCQVGCPFVCLISKDGDCPRVRVKTLNPNHNCFIAYDNSTIDYFTIAYYFKRKLQDNPKYKVKEMRADLRVAFEFNASHGKCKRAKTLILNKLHGSFKDEYNKLEGYVNELKISNPGSDIIINLLKDALLEGKRKFLRMYICFHAMKMGFKEGMRPFIGPDGAFLKGIAKGQLLVAVGVDSMNHFYPIAWAIGDKKTKRTWDWFLEMLKMSLELNMGEGYTFISDMQKGLVEAMKTILPDANHRYCVRYIEANWCKRWRSGKMKKLLWWSAWCTYEEDFDDQLKKIGHMDENAVKDLLHYPP
uniref:Uncharacterized protein n=1 Tax=Nicotiana tabacum TaxID=4097 RepID=A0A1S4CRQ1_TOBAC|nr:PREDICTED: uncharacterized protein LOC107821841 [Nicotiana tabacum]